MSRPKSKSHLRTPVRENERSKSTSKSTPPTCLTTTAKIIGGVVLFLIFVLIYILLCVFFIDDGYMWQMTQFLIAGSSGTTGMREYFSARANSTTGRYEGPGKMTSSFTHWKDVTEILQGFALKAKQNEIIRSNELGFQHQSSFFWQSDDTGPDMIGLGLNNEDHGFARPKFGQLLDHKTGSFADNDYEMLENYLNEFFLKKEWNTKADVHSVKAMTTRLLYEIHLGVKITEEEAVEFINFQGSALLTIATPYYLQTIFGQTISTWLSNYLFKSTQEKRAEYYHKFEKNLLTHLPKKDFADLNHQQQQLITSSVLDSLLFAGGLSVSTVLQTCVALLVDSVGSDISPAGPGVWKDLEQFKLDEENAGQFVWETLRRFPPVGALSYMEVDKEGNPSHQVYANLWMAAQDPTVFEQPDEWKIRPLSKYIEASTMFADQAIENGNNLSPNSHVCPAKELSLQLFTRFLKHFSKHSYTSLDGDNVKITEMGGASVTLRLREGTTCQQLRTESRNCINFLDEITGEEIETPEYKPEVFDNECFSAGIPKKNCIAYNQASWPWFFVSIYSFLFLNDIVKWKLPSLGFLLYSGFRMTETINLPIYLVDGFTAPLYSIAMYWGYMCYSKDSMKDNLVYLLKVHGIVYFVVYMIMGQDTAHLVFTMAFLPFYCWSLQSLWKNGAKVWCVGLAWGWVGPLLVYPLLCSNADPSIYGYPYSSDAPGQCTYYYLKFSDGLITFPLCFIGQLMVSTKSKKED